jgi:hypothetical protein
LLFHVRGYERESLCCSIFSTFLYCLVMLLKSSSCCRVRTSSGTFLRRGKDKIIRDIEKRIADYTFIPVGMRTG